MAVKTISDLLQSCISTDMHRMSLMGVAETSDEQGVFRVATDTHRLVAVKMSGPIEEKYTKIVYPEHVAMAIDASKYPNWQRVIPEESTRSIKLPIHALKQALRSVMAVANENANRATLAFSMMSCDIYAQSETTGVVRATIEALEPNNIDGFRIALNAKYLMDILPLRCEGKDNPKYIVLSMTENCRPVVITYDIENSWSAARVVVMPMALAEIAPEANGKQMKSKKEKDLATR